MPRGESPNQKSPPGQAPTGPQSSTKRPSKGSRQSAGTRKSPAARTSPTKKRPAKARRLLSPVTQLLGPQIRRLRLERNLSQEELAERSGLNYKYVGRVELSRVVPGADVLVRLADALDVSVGELFDTITPMVPNTHRLSPDDAEAMSAALKTLTNVVDRILARQQPPLPRRAPRRSRP